jgi:hypothetical protein
MFSVYLVYAVLLRAVMKLFRKVHFRNWTWLCLDAVR